MNEQRERSGNANIPVPGPDRDLELVSNWMTAYSRTPSPRDLLLPAPETVWNRAMERLSQPRHLTLHSRLTLLAPWIAGLLGLIGLLLSHHPFTETISQPIRSFFKSLPHLVQLIGQSLTPMILPITITLICAIGWMIPKAHPSGKRT